MQVSTNIYRVTKLVGKHDNRSFLHQIPYGFHLLFKFLAFIIDPYGLLLLLKFTFPRRPMDVVLDKSYHPPNHQLMEYGDIVYT